MIQFKVSGYDTYAHETYSCGIFYSREEAEIACRRYEKEALRNQPKELRDYFWISAFEVPNDENRPVRYSDSYTKGGEPEPSHFDMCTGIGTIFCRHCGYTQDHVVFKDSADGVSMNSKEILCPQCSEPDIFFYQNQDFAIEEPSLPQKVHVPIKSSQPQIKRDPYSYEGLPFPTSIPHAKQIVNNYIGKAIKMYNNNRNDKAIVIFKDVIRLAKISRIIGERSYFSKRLGICYYYLGMIYRTHNEENKNIVKSNRYLKKSLKLGLKDSYLQLAKNYTKLSDLDQVNTYLKIGIKLRVEGCQKLHDKIFGRKISTIKADLKQHKKLLEKIEAENPYFMPLFVFRLKKKIDKLQKELQIAESKIKE